ncbi:hypothetical protein D3C72_1550180 [compost metagenome]
MAASVFAASEALELSATHMVVTDQQDHEGELGMHPALAEKARRQAHQPDTEDQGGNHRGQHDAAVQLAFHGYEAFLANTVLALRMVDKQARQVEQPGKPADHADDMQRFDPEKKHGVEFLQGSRSSDSSG